MDMRLDPTDAGSGERGEDIRSVALGTFEGFICSEQVLLNSASKKKVIDEIADEVRKRCAVEKMSGVNGEDDIEGGVETIVPKPTRKEVIAASMLLQHYMVDAKDPDARLLETALVRYRRKKQLEASRALVASHIPDYFNDN
ncbi:hypothetical protein BDQ17DRAFT_1437790 [Cyathus striatus]|nr:hypothetical protein BDQ17DRAFT_1437790 [Cyathus striatus]